MFILTFLCVLCIIITTYSIKAVNTLQIIPRRANEFFLCSYRFIERLLENSTVFISYVLFALITGRLQWLNQMLFKKLVSAK